MQQVSDFKDFFERDLKIKDFSIDGKCSNCGGCCNDIIPLTNADINRIKIYIKKNDIKEIKHNLNFLLKMTYDSCCPFRDEQKQICTIYPVRPAVCRCFSCHDYYTEFINNRDKFKKVKPISCRETFFN